MVKRFAFIFLLLLFFPFVSGAEEIFDVEKTTEVYSEKIFKARVIEIIDEIEKEVEGGKKITQQNIKLLGLDNNFEKQEVVFYGIGDVEIVGSKRYSIGERVLVVATKNNDNFYNYYIIDNVRGDSLVFITILFLFFLILVGGWKGLRSIFSLLLTFLIIIFFIIPQIMAGTNPVFVVTAGSVFILVFIIYLTEGVNLRSHLATLSTFVSLILVIAISSLFVFLTKLTGAFSEDVFILINIGQQAINLKGMLLAGMIIGALGVLDDVVISQVSAVEQIIESNPNQSKKDVFKKAYKIGVSHISSMTNTLFLAYAGASLPLLILFVSPENPFTGLEQIISNEAVSTEIVRALSGSLGIILSVPITTFIATLFFTGKAKVNKNNFKTYA